jgi:hypothetical protein
MEYVETKSDIGLIHMKIKIIVLFCTYSGLYYFRNTDKESKRDKDETYKRMTSDQNLNSILGFTSTED